MHDDPILGAVRILRLPSTAMKEVTTRKTLIGKCCAVLPLAWQWENSISPSKPSGHYMYRQWSLYVPHSGHYMYRTVVTICTASLTFTIPRSVHTVYLCVLYGSKNKQPLFPYTTLTDWFV